MKYSFERKFHRWLFTLGQYLIERSKGLCHASAVDNVKQELKTWGVCIAPNCPFYGIDHGDEVFR